MMIRRRKPPAVLWAALLLLGCAWLPGLHAGPFDGYLVHPQSYLDVVRPAAAAQEGPAPGCGGAPASCSLQGATLEPAPAGPAATSTSTQPSSSSDSISSIKGVFPAGIRAAANPARLQPPYNVCVSSWAPMVRCTPGAEQSEYQGYQVELFKMAAAEVGWAESDYFFSCIDYTAMMDDLNDPAGNCSLTATGVEVSPANLAAGLKFTWPTYKSGLRVMISAQRQSGSTWAFSEIFHWKVWLLLGASGVAVGLMAGALEVLNRIDVPGTHMPSRKGWQSWLWYILAKLFHVTPHVGDPASDATRVLTLGYGFLVLVMISMYTAFAASRITAASIVHPVHSQQDLVGAGNKYRTLTWEQYQGKLVAHQDIHADGMEWEHESDLPVMLDALRSGSYSALVLDAPVLEFTAGTNEACDLFLVGDVFESFSLAIAFPPAFDDATVFLFSKAIVSLQTYQGALDMLDNVYIKTGGTDKCFSSSNSGGHGSGETIELRQVSGLWYILLITVGLSMLLTLQHNVRKDPAKMASVRRFSSFVGSSISRRVRPSSTGGPSGWPPHGPGGGTADTAVEAFTSGAPGVQGGRAAAEAAVAAAVQDSRGASGARAPSTLRVFLGTASVNRRVSDSEDESESPTSPKKQPRFSQLGHHGQH